MIKEGESLFSLHEDNYLFSTFFSHSVYLSSRSNGEKRWIVSGKEYFVENVVHFADIASAAVFCQPERRGEKTV